MLFAHKLSVNPYPGLRSKSIPVLMFLLCGAFAELEAQIIDDFSDGNLTSDPAWYGSTGSFTVNASGQLQLNATTAGTSSVALAFPLSTENGAEWEIYIRQSFAPSGANFSRFYLMSDQQDLRLPLNGYFLQFGEAGTSDAIELFRQSGTSWTSVCRAGNAAIASAFALRVRVSRDVSGHWQVFVDYAGDRNFLLASSGEDNFYRTSSYTGWLCTYSITNSTRFYLDDVYCVATKADDTTPPQVESVKALSSHSLEVSFSETLDPVSASYAFNYAVLDDHPQGVELSPDQRSVILSFEKSFVNGREAHVHIENVEDTSGNKIPATDMAFLFFEASQVIYRDIIITELLADPLPQIGLPTSEFIELYNRSLNPVQLDGYTLSDGASVGVCSDYILLPDQYVIVCPSIAGSEYLRFGPVIALPGFPTLNNSGDHLRLTSPEGIVIDSINYTSAWYRDEDRASGGWSLERINPDNWCDIEKNWTASLHPSGGTPGNQNNVHNNEPDVAGPKLLKASPLGNNKLQLTFDEILSADAPSNSRWKIEPSITVLQVSFAKGSSTDLLLTLADSLDPSLVYNISTYDVADCSGNLIKEGDNHFYLKQDHTSPHLAGVIVQSGMLIQLSLSEAIEPLSATALPHYNVNGLGSPHAVHLHPDQRTVDLTYAQNLTNGIEYRLEIRSITDRAGNVLDTTVSVLYFIPAPVSFKDIIITELMPDPVPPVGLPEAEFIELYNRSSNAIDLRDWSVNDEKHSGKLKPYILLPGSYVILTDAAQLFENLPNILKVNIPSLNNSGDVLSVRDSTGRTIDSLCYSATWYANDERNDGGWSLELIDPDNICVGDRNWTISESEVGGTPGFANSVQATLFDNVGPTIVSAVVSDSVSIVIQFDERLDNTLPHRATLNIEPHIEIANVAFRDASLTEVVVACRQPLKRGQIYALRLNNVYDCNGNRLQDAFTIATLIFPDRAGRGDIIINEILFNPRPTGVDFVEIYNCSNKLIDLKGWMLKNPQAPGGSGNFILENTNAILSPGDFRVYTQDAVQLKGEYISGVEETFRQVDLPAFNDDEGVVLLMESGGEIMDSVFYSEDRHSVFIQDREGVSLERISVLLSAAEPSNWASGSSVAGFATPGYPNSNMRVENVTHDAVRIEPEVIQPYDHTRSFARIKYHFDQVGFIANVRIFDQRGHTIRNLAANELLGATGFFRWDGDHDNGSPAGTGYYLVWFEVFDSTGNVKTFKKRLAVF